MIHSALSITLGIDFTVGKKAVKKGQVEKESTLYFTLQNLNPKRGTILEHTAVYSFLWYNLWEKGKRK